MTIKELEKKYPEFELYWAISEEQTLVATHFPNHKFAGDYDVTVSAYRITRRRARELMAKMLKAIA